ncbi:copper homeostasis protein CutC [Bombilactobacillus thymidiniphilus]|uniref:PF03932 family protein CutC n=1 Tax=Bombilactobacillus thymidiniphilus TaxID=2923363 RepID=A0ABY4PDP7_9LACO|nr:copper homeostasis protein CutC [Bombilactobacillus thymidiniphilus]UQS83740.1 copper homeostasis protein CutC [Bombilactobacillus thymidiniphilus]
MILEACVGEFSQVEPAIKHGAQRIELNSDLNHGGVTPSLGTIKQAIAYAKPRNIPVIVMLRPRGGNFVYTRAELEIMRNDAHLIEQAGADGIALGALTAADLIDTTAINFICQDLTLDLVFHMAFDAIPENEQFIALDWLIDHHFKRLLVHGTSLDQPLNIDHLKQLIKYANNRLEILPGGGITKNNVQHILTTLKIQQAHGTKIV